MRWSGAAESRSASNSFDSVRPRRALKDGMRTGLFAILILALATSAAPARQLSPPKPDQPAPPEKTLPLKRAGGGNPCAAFGPGFVRVEGSDTCVKLGGAIGIGVSGGR